MIGILCEKPSAKRNFEKALGGSQGFFNNEEYILTASRGHLYGYPKDPSLMVHPDKRDAYKKWSLVNLPWHEEEFLWRKQPSEGSEDTLKQIYSDLSGCDEICIATDDDESGEGQLLAWEIISGLNLNRPGVKISRMYFVDESEKSIQKAFRTRRTLPPMEQDPAFRKAEYREKWDYLSMQLSRIALLTGDNATMLREGRLKSFMTYAVAEQTAKVQAYKKIPYYQCRFRDENGNVFTSEDEPNFEKPDQVNINREPSPVKLDSREKKSTKPPRLLDLSGLSSLLAAKGLPAKTVLSTYQNLYEHQYVSYPRTDDKTITPDQFTELASNADRIAQLAGIDPALLTHRQARASHVKAQGAHGANRPGPNVPSSLKELDQYGPGAQDIYLLLARNSLSILAGDYEYEQEKAHLEKYPDFKCTVNIPQKAGWKAVWKMDDDEPSGKSMGTHASPFVYEGFPPKPQAPSMKWLMRILARYDVGTGATRTSTYSDMTDPKTNRPMPQFIDRKGKILLTEAGKLNYRLLQNTRIGSMELTRQLQQQMKLVEKGEADPKALLRQMEDLVMHDLNVMQKNGETVEKKQTDQREKASGVWNGETVEFTRTFGTHRFSDEEVSRLLAGETIQFESRSKDGKTVIFTGRLAHLEYKGHRYVGFEHLDTLNAEGKSLNADYVSGKWKRKDIRFKRTWRAHEFTDQEAADLLEGKEIIVSVKDKDGNPMTVKGKLAEQVYQGRKYVGFLQTAQVNESGEEVDDGYAHGIWHRKQIRFKREFAGHRFTDDEVKRLLAGESIEAEFNKKSGGTFKGRGCLKNKTWNGNKYVGFDLEFNNTRKKKK